MMHVYHFSIFICLLCIIGIIDNVHSGNIDQHLQKRENNNLQDKVTFTLYTKNNQNGIKLLINNQVTNSSINFNKTTKFVTHGWLYDKANVSYVDIKNAYIAKTDYNVILVNWTALSGPINDSQAVTNSGPVSQYYGTFVNFLISSGGNPNLFHLIGHGLGAHISGFVGAQVNTSNISRITGLDPSISYIRQLQQSDASFVDVIHTSGDVYGIYDAIGKADFYPNKGQVPQPWCGGNIEEITACSHFASVKFFNISIYEPTKYLATKCESYRLYKRGSCANESQSYMGENANSAANGAYFLSTYR